MNEENEGMLRNTCRMMQIIAFAMLMGVVVFMATAAFLVMGNNRAGQAGQGDNLPLISTVAIVFFLINTPLSFILPYTISGNAVRKLVASTGPNTRELLGIKQSTFIISRALLEGVGFLGTLAYLVEGHWLGMTAAVGAVGLMLLTFPTQRDVTEWVERQERALEEMRMSR